MYIKNPCTILLCVFMVCFHYINIFYIESVYTEVYGVHAHKSRDLLVIILSFITYQLTHVSWAHLISNISILLLISWFLEPMFKSGYRYILFFFLSGVLMGISHILLYPYNLVGASVSIFALLSVLLLLCYKTRTPSTILIGLVIISLFMTNLVIFVGTSYGLMQSGAVIAPISTYSHVMGFVIGLVLIISTNKFFLKKLSFWK